MDTTALVCEPGVLIRIFPHLHSSHHNNKVSTNFSSEQTKTPLVEESCEEIYRGA
jgi:hypothetical protein